MTATRMNGAMTIQVLSRDEEVTNRFLSLADSYEQEPGLSCKMTAAELLVGNAQTFPNLVVVDLDSMTDAVLEQISQFRQQGARSWIAVTYRSTAPERLVRAMRAGANDYVPPQPTIKEFGDLLYRSTEHASAAGGKTPGRLVTVFSNKGGVGTTTVAINLAAALATQVRGSVAVVDLVLQHGDVSVFLDTPPTYNVGNLISELNRADSSYLHSVMPKHASGLYVLPAPYAPDEAELVSAAQISKMLEKLCAAFDAVVVDAGNEFTDYTVAALDVADRIMLVTLPSLPSVRNTKRSLELFGRLHYDSSKVVIVVNRHDAKEPLSRRTIEEALGRPIHWTIPNDYLAAVRAINQGTTLRAIQPRGLLASNLEKLAATHVPAHAGGRPMPGRSPLPIKVGRVRTLLRRFSHGTS